MGSFSDYLCYKLDQEVCISTIDAYNLAEYMYFTLTNFQCVFTNQDIVMYRMKLFSDTIQKTLILVERLGDASSYMYEEENHGLVYGLVR